MRIKSYFIGLCLFLLCGCQSYKNVPYLQGDVTGSESLPTEVKNRSLYDARIMPKDLLHIFVTCPEEPELAVPFNLVVSSTQGNTLTGQLTMQQYLVDNEGRIDFPVLGTLALGGLTKSEAEQLIKERLKPQFHQTPIVNVRMVNYKISVLGEVASPGTFTISNEKVNLFEALAMAGDMTIYGLRQNVKLIRENSQGQQEVVVLNLNDEHILSSPYYYLQQNDILYVTPNKTKAKTADISSSTTIWFSVVGSLLSLVSVIVTIAR